MNEFRMLDGDRISLISFSSDASTILARTVVTMDSGEDVPLETQQTPNTNRTSASTILAGSLPSSGYCTRAFVAHLSASPGVKRGQVYVRLQVLDRNGLTVGLLCSGYIYEGHNLSLGTFEEAPSGFGLIVTNEADTTLVNNTAVTRTITVPTNARWLLEYGSVLNDDDVARIVDYIWDDGADSLGGWIDSGGLSLGASGESPFPVTVGNTGNGLGLAVRAPLMEGDRIRITWAAGGASAGGTAKSSAVVEEWIEL